MVAGAEVGEGVRLVELTKIAFKEVEEGSRAMFSDDAGLLSAVEVLGVVSAAGEVVGAASALVPEEIDSIGARLILEGVLAEA